MWFYFVEQSAGLLKSSTAPVAAATGTSVARSLSIPGILVSQTLAGQTLATINKGQTVVAPASFLQVHLAGFISGKIIVPFRLSGPIS
jgi:hypothetical protein